MGKNVGKDGSRLGLFLKVQDGKCAGPFVQDLFPARRTIIRRFVHMFCISQVGSKRMAGHPALRMEVYRSVKKMPPVQEAFSVVMRSLCVYLGIELLFDGIDLLLDLLV